MCWRSLQDSTLKRRRRKASSRASVLYLRLVHCTNRPDVLWVRDYSSSRRILLASNKYSAISSSITSAFASPFLTAISVATFFVIPGSNDPDKTVIPVYNVSQQVESRGIHLALLNRLKRSITDALGLVAQHMSQHLTSKRCRYILVFQLFVQTMKKLGTECAPFGKTWRIIEAVG